LLVGVSTEKKPQITQIPQIFWGHAEATERRPRMRPDGFAAGRSPLLSKSLKSQNQGVFEKSA